MPRIALAAYSLRAKPRRKHNAEYVYVENLGDGNSLEAALRACLASNRAQYRHDVDCQKLIKVVPVRKLSTAVNRPSVFNR
jgi:hypothetical protein